MNHFCGTNSLNQNITIDEINTVVDRLKNRKAPGIDKVPNEVLRSESVKKCLHKFFQYYFDTGLLPSCWSNAIIKPIPKSRTNDPRVPLNYRGINLLSCIYKCYSSVINRRLLKYLENNNLICDEQNGFREKRSCLEHIFTLHSIIKNRKNESKDTFTAFIDYTKCFDLIDRNMLYYKLVQYGVDGKMYRTLKKMYSNTMSCVNLNGNFSDWFYTTNGCRQGDVTSPTAFCVLINDLLKELKDSNIGIRLNDMIISVLAYADDIVLLADSPENLQKLINIVQQWCTKWRLIINPSKSKIVHFRNAPKQRTDYKFKLCNNGPDLEIVANYKYLGIFMDEFLTFKNATEILSAAAGRALGGMINKYRHLKEMSYKTYTKLYENLVCSVMDYSCAIWGTKNYDCMEYVHRRAIRFFTGVHRLSPIPGYVGDMGWISNRIRWKLETIRLWNRLVNINNNRLVKKTFLYDMNEHLSSNKSNFSAQVKQICCEVNLKDCFTNKTKIDLSLVRNVLSEKFAQEWQNSSVNMSKLDIYRAIKSDFGVEKYLELNISKYEKSLLSQLRYGILPLRVETGRFVNESRQNRICKLCDLNQVEDQLHFVFHCPLYFDNRQEMYRKARLSIPMWDNLFDLDKLSQMFSALPRSLGKYVKDSFILRRRTIYK